MAIPRSKRSKSECQIKHWFIARDFYISIYFFPIRKIPHKYAQNMGSYYRSGSAAFLAAAAFTAFAFHD